MPKLDGARLAIFSCTILLVLSLSVVPAAAATPNSPQTAQRFSVPLQPYNVALTPPGYLFGSGTWSGSISAGFSQMNYTVTLTGAMPDTQYIVGVSFLNSTGGAFARAYGLMTTNAQGNAVFAAKSRIFSGTVEIALGLSDKTNFSPPLRVLVADPPIGSDVPT
ncbi:MAG: hypothetical protein JRM90_07395 [Nitrososphaerota archaeon]|nr:hypothetical protein [Nitrososphaerota archaeon]